MATYTQNINLEKPATSENFNLSKINSNWDKIDTAFGTKTGLFRVNTTVSTSSSGNASVDSAVTSGYYPVSAYSTATSLYIVNLVRYSGSWYVHVTSSNGSAVEASNIPITLVLVKAID